MVPGWDAPGMVTGVPIGSDGEVQPSDWVFPPVPEQCAACPRNTCVASVKMKLAVHCAPLVSSCTPGWMVALDAGAHVCVAETDDGPPSMTAAATESTTSDSLRIVKSPSRPGWLRGHGSCARPPCQP